VAFIATILLLLIGAASIYKSEHIDVEDEEDVEDGGVPLSEATDSSALQPSTYDPAKLEEPLNEVSEDTYSPLKG